MDKFEIPVAFSEKYRLFEKVFDIRVTKRFIPLSIFGHSVCEWETFGTSCLFTKQYFSFNLSQKLSPQHTVGSWVNFSKQAKFFPTYLDQPTFLHTKVTNKPPAIMKKYKLDTELHILISYKIQINKKAFASLVYIFENRKILVLEIKP